MKTSIVILSLIALTSGVADAHIGRHVLSHEDEMNYDKPLTASEARSQTDSYISANHQTQEERLLELIYNDIREVSVTGDNYIYWDISGWWEVSVDLARQELESQGYKVEIKEEKYQEDTRKGPYMKVSW